MKQTIEQARNIIAMDVAAAKRQDAITALRSLIFGGVLTGNDIADELAKIAEDDDNFVEVVTDIACYLDENCHHRGIYKRAFDMEQEAAGLEAMR
jgi:hypothetical protein